MLVILEINTRNLKSTLLIKNCYKCLWDNNPLKYGSSWQLAVEAALRRYLLCYYDAAY